MQLDRPFKFECTHCGKCCRWPGDVRLTNQDIDRVAARLGLDAEVAIDRYTHLAANRQGLSLKEQADGSCIFLKDDLCSIYEARPEQCRAFPYKWTVPDGCPGITYLD